MSNFSGFEMNDKPELWAPGWYPGGIVAEYETSGTFAKVHRTEDVVSGGGDSRNLKLCVGLVDAKKEQPKFLNTTINYRPEALSDDRKEFLRNTLAEAKKTKAKLGGDNFRDAMALSKLGELEDAGLTVVANGHGGFDTDKLVGSNAFFYIGLRAFQDESKKKDRAATAEELKRYLEGESTGVFLKITQVSATGKRK